MRSRISSAGKAAAAALLAVVYAGCQQPRVHAMIVGSVVDATTEGPIPGVVVGSHDQTTTTDDAGHYRLEVTVGVRELGFALPDGRSLRKYVVPRDGNDVRLDVLAPAADAPATPGLLLHRGFPWDKATGDLMFDAGNQLMLSEADAFGNDDHFFTPPWNYQRVASPRWAPAEGAIYFSDDPSVGPPDDFPRQGLQRFAPATGELTPMWFDANPPLHLAVAPDGHALVASDGDVIYLFTDLLDPPASHRIIARASTSALLFPAWGPAGDIFVSLATPIDAAPSGFRYRIARLAETGATLDEHFIDDAHLPLPLPDGALVYWHGGAGVLDPGIRLRETDGTTRELMSGDWLFPVAFDRAADAITYRVGDELHRRHLSTGLDLVIVQSVNDASVKPAP